MNDIYAVIGTDIMNKTAVNILSSSKYSYLQTNLLELNPAFTPLRITNERFPDGEQHWIIENVEQVRAKPIVYLCGTIDEKSIFELYNIASTLVREQCSSLHLVLPYFGYSTMERATQAGEVVTAKNIACLLSSIPSSPHGNFIYMLDLHSHGIQYYFEHPIHPIHLTAQSVIEQMIKDCDDNIVLASTDMGRAKWIEKIGNKLNLPTAYIMKKRLDGSHTKVQAISADVKNKNVVIFDDMIRSGSSIIKAANAYRDAGAQDIHAVTVHGIFVNDAVDQILAGGLIKDIRCTNSHANVYTLTKNPSVKIYDIASVIQDGLML